MNAPPQETNSNGFAAIIGGVKMRAEFIDGSCEDVMVRQLPIRLYKEYLEAQDSEAKILSVLCGKPVEWADGLKIESFEAILDEGEKINADFFSRWVKRQFARKERIMPGIADKLMRQIMSDLKTTSPSAPLPVASPSDKSQTTPSPS